MYKRLKTVTVTNKSVSIKEIEEHELGRYAVTEEI
jgi:hypothetical protein